MAGYDRVAVEGGSEGTPGLLQGIADHKSDHQHDEHEEGVQSPWGYRWQEKKRGETPELSVLQYFLPVELKCLWSEASAQDAQDEDHGVDN